MPNCMKPQGSYCYLGCDSHCLVDKWWCFMENCCFHSWSHKIWTQAVEDFCATHTSPFIPLYEFESTYGIQIFHVYKRVSYSSIKICNSLSPCILKLKQEKLKFKVTYGQYLTAHTFYSKWVSFRQSNRCPSSTSIMSPTITINDRS